jgi:hypothetical protein
MMFSVKHCFGGLFVFALRQENLGESDVRSCFMEFRLRRQIQHIR